jgi:diaminohydroxyphosphoribosylaminopyrimidine deaminase/5-amino-6-(5-phosphoribosylamino)uracil reductase
MAFTSQDHLFMARALQLAELGLCTTMPNPRVGCVIVKEGNIVGEGAHLRAGDAHAEVFALRQAGEQARGATAYVTLEPCNHTGRTAPCSHALVNAGIKKVIAAMQDPNPLVAGSGLTYLQAHGIDAASGLMHAQAEALNPGFIARMTRNTPLVRSKIAATLDGKTALNNGVSQWITGEAARLDVQHWRARSCAILTGVGTVLADNPSMTIRLHSEQAEHKDTGPQPLRIIVDSSLKTPTDAKILAGGNVLIAFAHGGDHKQTALLSAGAELLCIPDDQGRVCLKTLLSHLAAREINEVLVEAGAGLNGALLAQNLIDELMIYYAPKLMGGAAKNMFAIPELTVMSQVRDLLILDVRTIGNDIRLRARPLLS